MLQHTTTLMLYLTTSVLDGKDHRDEKHRRGIQRTPHHRSDGLRTGSGRIRKSRSKLPQHAGRGREQGGDIPPRRSGILKIRVTTTHNPIGYYQRHGGFDEEAFGPSVSLYIAEDD
jgi:hypothetical protein